MEQALVSMSDIRRFKACRQRWAFSSPLRGNWSFTGSNKNLVAGDLAHQALARFYSPEKDKAYCAEGMLDFYDERSDIQLEAAKGEPTFDKIVDEVGLVRDALDAYAPWAQKHDNWTPISTELDLIVPLPLDVYNKQVIYCGRADGLVERDGDFFLLEHKTCTRYPEFDTLLLDEQCIAYLWAANIDPQFKDTRPIGTQYTFLLKKAQQIPKVLKNGSLSRSKALLAGTTYETYARRIAAIGASASDYAAELRFLKGRPNPFVQRVEIRRTDKALQVFGNDLLATVAEMMNPMVTIYPAPSWWTCRYCSFKSACSLARCGIDPLPLLKGAYAQREARYNVDVDTEELVTV